jgi:hypothetical protein
VSEENIKAFRDWAATLRKIPGGNGTIPSESREKEESTGETQVTFVVLPRAFWEFPEVV